MHMHMHCITGGLPSLAALDDAGNRKKGEQRRDGGRLASGGRALLAPGPFGEPMRVPAGETGEEEQHEVDRTREHRGALALGQASGMRRQPQRRR